MKQSEADDALTCLQVAAEGASSSATIEALEAQVASLTAQLDEAQDDAAGALSALGLESAIVEALGASLQAYGADPDAVREGVEANFEFDEGGSDAGAAHSEQPEEPASAGAGTANVAEPLQQLTAAHTAPSGAGAATALSNAGDAAADVQAAAAAESEEQHPFAAAAGSSDSQRHAWPAPGHAAPDDAIDNVASIDPDGLDHARRESAGSAAGTAVYHSTGASFAGFGSMHSAGSVEHPWPDAQLQHQPGAATHEAPTQDSAVTAPLQQPRAGGAAPSPLASGVSAAPPDTQGNLAGAGADPASVGAGWDSSDSDGDDGWGAPPTAPAQQAPGAAAPASSAPAQVEEAQAAFFDNVYDAAQPEGQGTQGSAIDAGPSGASITQPSGSPQHGLPPDQLGVPGHGVFAQAHAAAQTFAQPFAQLFAHLAGPDPGSPAQQHGTGGLHGAPAEPGALSPHAPSPQHGAPPAAALPQHGAVPAHAHAPPPAPERASSSGSEPAPPAVPELEQPDMHAPAQQQHAEAADDEPLPPEVPAPAQPHQHWAGDELGMGEQEPWLHQQAGGNGLLPQLHGAHAQDADAGFFEQLGGAGDAGVGAGDISAPPMPGTPAALQDEYGAADSSSDAAELLLGAPEQVAHEHAADAPQPPHTVHTPSGQAQAGVLHGHPSADGEGGAWLAGASDWQSGWEDEVGTQEFDAHGATPSRAAADPVPAFPLQSPAPAPGEDFFASLGTTGAGAAVPSAAGVPHHPAVPAAHAAQDGDTLHTPAPGPVQLPDQDDPATDFADWSAEGSLATPAEVQAVHSACTMAALPQQAGVPALADGVDTAGLLAHLAC